jgi:hypothetical protein
VVAVVWDRQPSDLAVGHVLLAEVSGRVLWSSFPYPHAMHGANTMKSWEETLAAEGRQPTGVFKVFVPNDDAFDTAIALERTREWWYWYPYNENQTNCSVGSFKALESGGVKIEMPWMPWSPNDFLDEMNRLSKNRKSGVTKLPSIPWGKQ